MGFPNNPSPGTDEYGTVWIYSGTVNGWYRQELRDITLQADTFNLVWPVQPT